MRGLDSFELFLVFGVLAIICVCFFLFCCCESDVTFVAFVLIDNPLRENSVRGDE